MSHAAMLSGCQDAPAAGKENGHHFSLPLLLFYCPSLPLPVVSLPSTAFHCLCFWFLMPFTAFARCFTAFCLWFHCLSCRVVLSCLVVLWFYCLPQTATALNRRAVRDARGGAAGPDDPTYVAQGGPQLERRRRAFTGERNSPRRCLMTRGKNVCLLWVMLVVMLVVPVCCHICCCCCSNDVVDVDVVLGPGGAILSQEQAQSHPRLRIFLQAALPLLSFRFCR